MTEKGLVSCHVKKRRNLTQSDGSKVFSDRIGQKFEASEPGTSFVGDITEIRTWEGKTYLATVIDLFNRGMVGYAMATSYPAELVSAAIDMAKRNNLMKPDAVFHSDHGSQYTSAEFQKVCTDRKIVQSMGRVGSCFDNAAAESFFATAPCSQKAKNITPLLSASPDGAAIYHPSDAQKPNKIRTPKTPKNSLTKRQEHDSLLVRATRAVRYSSHLSIFRSNRQIASIQERC